MPIVEKLQSPIWNEFVHDSFCALTLIEVVVNSTIIDINTMADTMQITLVSKFELVFIVLSM
jgi:hypothetical protein